MSEQCTALYAGEFWPGEQCREQSDHATVAHVATYSWSGKTYRDPHQPHDHHVDSKGRTWK